jgi:Ca2+-binding EF-hand superfamily protein
MIDQNRDGFIDQQDLHEMFASLGTAINMTFMHLYRCLGKEVTDDFIEKMITEAPGAINFTMFLTLFGEKLTGTDPEEV